MAKFIKIDEGHLWLTFGGRSGFDPDLRIGNLGEQPIEDYKFQQPQDSESGDIGPDHQCGLSQMMKMVCGGEVASQRRCVQGETDARYGHHPERKDLPPNVGTPRFSPYPPSVEDV